MATSEDFDMATDMRWGQQFRFFREEVIASMTRYRPGDPTPDDENLRVDTDRN